MGTGKTSLLLDFQDDIYAEVLNNKWIFRGFHRISQKHLDTVNLLSYARKHDFNFLTNN